MRTSGLDSTGMVPELQKKSELSSTVSTSFVDQHNIWVCLKIVYIPDYGHLIGIMIINHWV